MMHIVQTEACKGIRRSFVKDMGPNNRHMTRKQWFDTMNEDDIPKPPSYPHIEERRASRYFRRSGILGPLEVRDRLEGWARCDSEGKDATNSLFHAATKVAKYCRKYDTEERMPSNPCNQGPTTPLQPISSLPHTLSPFEQGQLLRHLPIVQLRYEWLASQVAAYNSLDPPTSSATRLPSRRASSAHSESDPEVPSYALRTKRARTPLGKLLDKGVDVEETEHDESQPDEGRISNSYLKSMDPYRIIPLITEPYPYAKFHPNYGV
ncbi:hypothetical protein HO173_012912 [Letharia columbiana]|uniref:Uncharacterized protein n=1 Tax=Letharia columbiana TaxID=112416 RepID=A0A8H6CKA9_9LECA|nr:uncharacterized protein HO173_012912 [Letharia columbiana]KAF6224671.1 hypothetical protein HO173_012912 [Letharia columbiana]